MLPCVVGQAPLLTQGTPHCLTCPDTDVETNPSGWQHSWQSKTVHHFCPSLLGMLEKERGWTALLLFCLLTYLHTTIKQAHNNIQSSQGKMFYSVLTTSFIAVFQTSDFFSHLHQNIRSLKTRGMSVITPMQYKHVTSLRYYLLFYLC